MLESTQEPVDREKLFLSLYEADMTGIDCHLVANIWGSLNQLTFKKKWKIVILASYKRVSLTSEAWEEFLGFLYSIYLSFPLFTNSPTRTKLLSLLL